MRPGYSERVGTCTSCKTPIPKGEFRLQDVIRIGVTKEGKAFYRRVLWHYQCYIEYLEKWKAEHTYTPPDRKGVGGRPRSTLPKEIQAQRGKVLQRISYLRRYYTEEGLGLNPIDPTKFANNDPKELERLKIYRVKISTQLQLLQNLGGIPSNLMAEYGGLLEGGSNEIGVEVLQNVEEPQKVED